MRRRPMRKRLSVYRYEFSVSPARHAVAEDFISYVEFGDTLAKALDYARNIAARNPRKFQRERLPHNLNSTLEMHTTLSP